jgi:ATP-binding cassette subfamily B protein
LFLLVNYFSGRLRKKWKAVKSLESASMSVVQEVLSTLRVVKSFGREDQEEERFVSQSNQRIAEHLGAVRTGGVYDFLVGASVSAATAAVLLLGTLHVLSGLLSLGELLMVMAYMTQIFGPVRSIGNTATRTADGLASAERVFMVLTNSRNHRQARRIENHKQKGGFKLKTSISRTRQSTVLQEITLEIPAGSRVGLRGVTGAGKSTLVSLLMRFYDPDSGRILLDGVDIRDYRHVDLRNQFAIILQDPVLFSTTIEENISYGRPGAGREDIETAARLAKAHDFISGLSDDETRGRTWYKTFRR